MMIRNFDSGYFYGAEKLKHLILRQHLFVYEIRSTERKVLTALRKT